MVERQALEGERRAVDGTDGVGQRHGARHREGGGLRLVLGLHRPGHDENGHHAGQPLGNGLELVEDREDLSAIPVMIDRNKHCRLDLAEAVEHALHAEIGRAGGPDRAEARRRQHAGDGLGAVRHHRGDTVADTDALCRQPLLQAGDQTAQVLRRQAQRRAVLAAEDEDLCLVDLHPRSEQVLGEVQPCLGEKARAGHSVIGKHRGALLANDTAPVPHRVPEGRPIRDGKGMQVGIIHEAPAQASA